MTTTIILSFPATGKSSFVNWVRANKFGGQKTSYLDLDRCFINQMAHNIGVGQVLKSLIGGLKLGAYVNDFIVLTSEFPHITHAIEHGYYHDGNIKFVVNVPLMGADEYLVRIQMRGGDQSFISQAAKNFVTWTNDWIDFANKHQIPITRFDAITPVSYTRLMEAAKPLN